MAQVVQKLLDTQACLARRRSGEHVDDAVVEETHGKQRAYAVMSGINEAGDHLDRLDSNLDVFIGNVRLLQADTTS